MTLGRLEKRMYRSHWTKKKSGQNANLDNHKKKRIIN